MIKSLITERSHAISINSFDAIEKRLYPNILRMRLELGLLNPVTMRVILPIALQRYKGQDPVPKSHQYQIQTK